MYNNINKRYCKNLIITTTITLLAGFVIFSASLQAAEVKFAQPAKVISRCGRGSLLDVSGTRVLLVAGSSYEMGYQQGKLLKTEVQTLVKQLLFFARGAETAGIKGFSPGTIESVFERTKKYIDQRYFEEMQGLADGAKLPLRDVQLANIFPELFHCSGFALFGQATVEGRLFHGRILDYMTEVGLQDLAVVTVAKPNGYNPFITVGYVGFLGSVTGMNNKQIAIGEMGGRGEGNWDGMPMSFLVRKALEEADTLDKAVEIFKQTPRTCEYYYVISDGKLPDGQGLACTSEKFEVVKSGHAHPRLPYAIKDAVLMSAGQRYEHLASLVQENYGVIDVNMALDFMNRPVAMEGCLHRVLFAPQELDLWVANAASIEEENYAACYQPYYKYNFKSLLDTIPETAPPSAAKIPEPTRQDNPPAATTEAAKTEEEVVISEVSEAVKRDTPISLIPNQERFLEKYRVEQKAFNYRKKLLSKTSLYNIYRVTFPSALISEIPENNTIYCEYYSVPGQQKRPAVIVLDIADGSMIIPRLIAHGLASNSVDACFMTMPHYGFRKSTDKTKQLDFTGDIQVFINAVMQAVMDVRQTARWLASQELVDENRIGLCGTSLGGFITALTAGVDGRFPRVAILLAGGDLVSVLTTDSPEVRSIQKDLAERGFTDDKLRELLEPIEPLNFADRMKNSNVLMINGSADKVVPPDCAEKLAGAVDTDIEWFDADHYSMVKYIIPVLTKVSNHFSPESW